MLAPNPDLGGPAGLLSPSLKNGKMIMRTRGFYDPQSLSNPHWARRACPEATPGARRARLGSGTLFPAQPACHELSLPFHLSLSTDQRPGHLCELKIPVLTGTRGSLEKKEGTS